MGDQTIIENQQKQQNNLLNYYSTDPVIQTDLREHTMIETPKGNITIIHEITLGEIILSVLIVAILIFNMFQSLRR